MALQAAVMDTTPVDADTAASIEAAEARAWADLYSAAPAAWAQSVGLGASESAGALVLRWAATGRRYFSRVIGLGVTVPATEADIDQILGAYEQAGISMFLLQSLPHCRPTAYEHWLADRGLEPFDQQDRIIRDGSPLTSEPTPAADRELRVELVTRATADEWSDFLQTVYRLDSGPWLPELIGRPGWFQYVAREEGTIVATRGMYVGSDGAAWLGMDGPVPGIMTDDYQPDAALCAFIVADGLARGACVFLTDIEVPSPDLDTPAYRDFAQLGFRRPYTRIHHARL